jgi:hypothetical protein
LAKEISEVLWRARGPHASVSSRLAVTIDQLELPGFTVCNDDGTSIVELAVDVLTRLGWPIALAAPD